MPFLTVQLQISPPAATEVDTLRRASGDPSYGHSLPHCTLVPPQQVAAVDLPRALAILWDVAHATLGFSVRLGAAAYWTQRRTLHFRLLEGEDRVKALRERVHVPPFRTDDKWPFVPHVTIAADIDATRAGIWTTALQGFETESDVTAIHVRLRSARQGWATAASFHLAKPPPRGLGD
jgi:2'-5' RNA ligase